MDEVYLSDEEAPGNYQAGSGSKGGGKSSGVRPEDPDGCSLTESEEAAVYGMSFAHNNFVENLDNGREEFVAAYHKYYRVLLDLQHDLVLGARQDSSLADDIQDWFYAYKQMSRGDSAGLTGASAGASAGSAGSGASAGSAEAPGNYQAGSGSKGGGKSSGKDGVAELQEDFET